MIKQEKWEEFQEFIKGKMTEDDNFYYYEDDNNVFGINKKDYSVNFTGKGSKDINYYINYLQLTEYLEFIEN